MVLIVGAGSGIECGNANLPEAQGWKSSKEKNEDCFERNALCDDVLNSSMMLYR